MSNSSLANYIDRGSGNYNNRTALVTGIVIHSAATVGGCDTLSEIIKMTPAGSFNYGISTDGEIGLYVDEIHRAWSTGNPEVDHKTISIVVCNSSLSADLPISARAYDSLIKLCTDICRRNFITKLVYTGSPAGSNLYLHRWYASVNCPGRYLESRISDLVLRVNTNLSRPQLADSNSEALLSQTNIVVDALNPYVITVDPSNTSKIDYNKLILSKVVGVMFYCGGLYSDSLLHIKKKAYVSSTLKTQIANLDNALPYALYCDVRAWSKESATAECEALYYVISRYPPKLGIWLKLDFGLLGSPNTVMDTYYKYITKWGLKDKCGIYATKSQVSKINWTSDYCKKFSLWLIDPLSGVSNLNELLVPNFFKF